MSAGLDDVFGALRRSLDREGMRWYVFGAQAVLAHGLPRLTADVDVTVDPGGRANHAVLDVLGGEQIAPRAPEFDEFLRTSRLLPLVHTPSGIAVDVVLASDGIEQDFLARAVTVDLGGVDVPVLSVEDLIATKSVAGRRKDLDDIVGILRQQHGRIDLERLRVVLAAFDEALEEPRASRTFARALRRHERRGRRV